eukprot:349632-Chlamydomonas_euryale.AAC.30
MHPAQSRPGRECEGTCVFRCLKRLSAKQRTDASRCKSTCPTQNRHRTLNDVGRAGGVLDAIPGRPAGTLHCIAHTSSSVSCIFSRVVNGRARLHQAAFVARELTEAQHRLKVGVQRVGPLAQLRHPALCTFQHAHAHCARNAQQHAALVLHRRLDKVLQVQAHALAVHQQDATHTRVLHLLKQPAPAALLQQRGTQAQQALPQCLETFRIPRLAELLHWALVLQAGKHVRACLAKAAGIAELVAPEQRLRICAEREAQQQRERRCKARVGGVPARTFHAHIRRGLVIFHTHMRGKPSTHVGWQITPHIQGTSCTGLALQGTRGTKTKHAGKGHF